MATEDPTVATAADDDASMPAGAGAAGSATTEPAALRDVELYGGAITAVLPSTFNDISDFRPVPDHQEVYAHLDTDSSVIIEINEMAEVADADAAAYHFRDLAEAAKCDAADAVVELSEALSTEVDMPGMAGVECYLHGLVGLQSISKFHEGADAKNRVRLYLALIRIPSKTSDILIVLNAPVQISDASSSAKSFHDVADSGSALDLFRGIIASFKIADMGLFGE